ncbi:MAG: KUP/HAK/KT family potassium transporter [Burkholderiaceae bacterium]
MVWAVGWALLWGLDGHIDLSSLALGLVLVAACTALWLPPWAVVLVCLLSALCFDLAFVPPRGELRVALYAHWLLLVALLVVSTLVALLTARQRRMADQARQVAAWAVISGAYSMTRQAIQLGFLPRMAVRFTSAREAGQIYMPAVNAALLAGVVVAVLAFRSSSALAGAYGIAVTLTMLITTLLAYVVVRRAWRLPLPLALGATLFFVAIDLLLVAGCAVKLFDGGWMPLALGLLLFLLMSTWWRGRALLLQGIRSEGLALQDFVDGVDTRSVPRASRTAVYAVADPETVPQALLHNLKHNQVLHERNLILTVHFHEQPWVDERERLHIQPLGHGFWRVAVHFGFMDTPDVPAALRHAAEQGLPVPMFETSWFLSRETVVPTPGGGMADWRERLFAAMSRNGGSAADYFRLPDNAVVELGTRVQI